MWMSFQHFYYVSQVHREVSWRLSNINFVNRFASLIVSISWQFIWCLDNSLDVWSGKKSEYKKKTRS